MNINDIAKLLLRGENISDYGDVSSAQDGDLIILYYTRDAMYNNMWNDVEQLCRGLIINHVTGEIVARPFKKFFNWGQHYGQNGEAVALPSYSSHLVNVFEKMDGSLGILYRQNGEYKVATRGSFSSEQALFATRFLQENYDLSDLPVEYTLLFEIIYPENRVVVDYGDREDLVLLGVVNRFTGKELSFYPDVYNLAEDFGFTLPTVYKFNNPTEILEAAGKLVGSENEGYVLLYSDGERYKIKGDDYLYLHKIVTNITKKQVFDMWYRGVTFPEVPDEFMDDVNKWYAEFNKKKEEIKSRCNRNFDKAPKTNNRKDFALWAKKKPYSHILFLMYGGRTLDDMEITLKETVKKECIKN